MDVQTAVDNYERAMGHCDNLVHVHRAAGDGGVGRRIEETSVNRGTIVLAVAAWQAFVQDIAKALSDRALAEVHLLQSARVLPAVVQHWKTDFDQAVYKFATPDPAKSRALWKHFGFDPRPKWTWTQLGGRGNKAVTVEPKHVDEVMEQWLRVRHAVAHGHANLPALPVLSAVRNPKASAKAKASPNLRLPDAEDCMRFFRSIAKITADAAAGHVQDPMPAWEKDEKLALGLHISHVVQGAYRKA